MSRIGLCLTIFVALGCGSPSAGVPDGSDPVGDTSPTGDAPDGAPDGTEPACQASGILDTSFGSGGVTTLFGLTPGVAVGVGAVTVDAESWILAAGGFLFGARSCVLARLLPNGQIDAAFGTAGIVRQSIGDRECAYTDVGVQLDGKIVVVGVIDVHTSPRGVLARYLADGTLDLTFGQEGLVVAPPPPAISTYFSALAIDSEQRIVVAGTFTEGLIGEEVFTFLTRRYMPDGGLDPNFGTEGTAEEPFRNGGDAAWDLSIQSNGRILVVGTTSAGPSATSSRFEIVGYKPDGRKDPMFGSSGVVSFDGGGSGIARDAQDRVVAVGVNPTPAGLIPLLRGDGSIESTIIDTSVPSGFTSMALDAAGRYVAINSCGTCGGSGIVNVVLARYSADGRDLTFGTNGFAAEVSLPGIYTHGVDVAIQPDGGIVTVGEYGFGDRMDGYVARHCP